MERNVLRSIGSISGGGVCSARGRFAARRQRSCPAVRGGMSGGVTRRAIRRRIGRTSDVRKGGNWIGQPVGKGRRGGGTGHWAHTAGTGAAAGRKHSAGIQRE